MALKDDWKETGKDLGGAFANLGKTLVRTGKTAVDKAVDWAESDDAEKKAEEAAEEVKEAEEAAEEVKEAAEKDSNVFNDGSWRETGKGLGQAFAGLGKTILDTGKTVVDKATDWADKKDDKSEEEKA